LDGEGGVPCVGPCAGELPRSIVVSLRRQ
jgi:hypothetical protein